MWEVCECEIRVDWAVTPHLDSDFRKINSEITQWPAPQQIYNFLFQVQVNSDLDAELSLKNG